MSDSDSSPAYSPRILYIVVTGPFSSGKTTFIRTLCGLQTYTEDNTALRVAVDIGQIALDEQWILKLIAPPGSRGIDSRWGNAFTDGTIIGFILMIDSAYPELFRQASTILSTFRAISPFLYVVAANKQDRPDAWSVSDLRIAMRNSYIEEDDAPMLPCIATDKESVKNELLALLYRVLEELDD